MQGAGAIAPRSPTGEVAALAQLQDEIPHDGLLTSVAAACAGMPFPSRKAQRLAGPREVPR